jgi:hypothetical protein
VTETRQTFAGLAHWEIVFWYVLIVISTAIFFLGVALLVLKYRRGRTSAPSGGVGEIAGRALRAATIVFTHRWIKRRDPLAGLGH